MKIAVIQPKMIGDVLITSVIFEVLKEKYPNSQLHYIINSNTLPVVLNNPYIDEYILLNPEIEKGFKGFFSQTKRIKKQKYDVIIDSYGKLKTAFFCFFSSANKTISFHKWYSNALYTDTVIRTKHSISTATKAIEHRLQLLEPLGVDFKVIKPTIYLSHEELSLAKDKLISNGINLSKPLVMISVVGSSMDKTYPYKFMANCIDMISKDNDLQLLFNYIPNQKEDAKKIFDLCTPEAQNKILFDFYASSLRDFMAITHFCSALIGNEGGATNIAKALNIPTFTIFSPFILKNDWNMFENGDTNVSVHISDFIDEEISKKKNTSAYYYSLFKPLLFENKLNIFIKNNILKS